MHWAAWVAHAVWALLLFALKHASAAVNGTAAPGQLSTMQLKNEASVVALPRHVSESEQDVVPEPM
jgi:hypothetical protein